MAEDEWDIEDDAMLMLHDRDHTHPEYVARMFFQGALAGHLDDELRGMTTPSSRATWDFDDLREVLGEIVDPATGSVARPARPDATDVAWVRVLAGQPEVRIVDRPTTVLVAAALMLVWHPEPGIWLVHALAIDGEPDYAAVDGVPRPSPGVAPAY